MVTQRINAVLNMNIILFVRKIAFCVFVLVIGVIWVIVSAIKRRVLVIIPVNKLVINKVNLVQIGC